MEYWNSRWFDFDLQLIEDYKNDISNKKEAVSDSVG